MDATRTLHLTCGHDGECETLVRVVVEGVPEMYEDGALLCPAYLDVLDVYAPCGHPQDRTEIRWVAEEWLATETDPTNLDI